MPAEPETADLPAIALAIVLELGSRPAPMCGDVDLEEGGYGLACALCDTEPPGGARSLPDSQHAPDCPWRQAVDVVRRTHDG